MKGLTIYSLVSYVLMTLFVICIFSVFSALAQMPVEPNTVLDTLALLPALQEAVESKNWAMASVIGLMTITWLIKRFVLSKDGSQKDLLPALSAGLGALMGGSVTAISSSDPISGALGGMMLGNAASGMYDMLKKTPKSLKKAKNK